MLDSLRAQVFDHSLGPPKPRNATDGSLYVARLIFVRRWCNFRLEHTRIYIILDPGRNTTECKSPSLNRDHLQKKKKTKARVVDPVCG